MADNKSCGDRTTDIEIPKPPKVVKVNMDFSETIKGLKAIQREAKKATAALRELEGVRTDMVVFDEMHTMCFCCGGQDFEIKRTIADDGTVVSFRRTCKDCGWMS